MNEIFTRIEYFKSKIISLKDSDIRTIMISDYIMLLNLLKKMNKINDEDYKNYCCQFDKTSYINHLHKRISHYQNELVLNNQKLLTIISELKIIYLDIYLDNEPIVPNNDISLLNEEFFGALGKDVLDLYNRMKLKRIISVTSDDYGGWCYEQRIDDSYILVKYCDKITETTTLIHEMGHAYNSYLLKNCLMYTSCSIVGEMMSLLFEKLYIRFLENNNFDTDYLWYNYYLCLYDSVFDSFFISNLIKDKKIKFHKSDINCESIYNDKELREYSNKLECYIDESSTLTLRSFSYIISDLVSDYFFYLMETDYEKGFKSACKFSKETKGYSVKAILDKYVGDLSYTESRIRRVIEKGRSYQKRN